MGDKTDGASGALGELKQILAEVTDLNRAAAVLEWDQETYMPPAGIQTWAEQLATLLKLAHTKLASKQVGKLLDQLQDELADRPFDSDEASLVRVTRRDYDEGLQRLRRLSQTDAALASLEKAASADRDSALVRAALAEALWWKSVTTGDKTWAERAAESARQPYSSLITCRIERS